MWTDLLYKQTKGIQLRESSVDQKVDENGCQPFLLPSWEADAEIPEENWESEVQWGIWQVSGRRWQDVTNWPWLWNEFTFKVRCISWCFLVFRAEAKLQSSRVVKSRQKVGKQTNENKPIYHQSELVSRGGWEKNSGLNIKILKELMSRYPNVSLINQIIHCMFTC